MTPRVRRAGRVVVIDDDQHVLLFFIPRRIGELLRPLLEGRIPDVPIDASD